MEYNPELHSIKCPKCGHGMAEIRYGDVAIDRCSNCHGLWFDTGEAELLKTKWMGDALDIGDPSLGKRWDKVEDIACPRCGKDMEKLSDPKQKHIWYEMCPEHGMFMDAGEFSDYKHETLADRFRSLIKGARR
ncbi:zf-TFIIB domain-containing protein [Kineobactrum salinum]|uniref:Zf-TFIIB domain-containing protein n=1 Tax=Kineobactrum salinum TaxID=2708301 RepID=A0A6C0U001_9GAMM|nr:zf-TFIIB domain-containing protein [Kineobactrum salinum]QIB65422.1 zf-TFIIB domain-containing protein [Kineobactrum salinum]